MSSSIFKNLKCGVIDENTTDDGVQINSDLKVDVITESTVNNGVSIENMKVENGTLDWSNTYSNQSEFSGGYSFEAFSSSTTGSSAAAGGTCDINCYRFGPIVTLDIRYTHNSSSQWFVDLDTAISSRFRPVVDTYSRANRINANANGAWLFGTFETDGSIRIGKTTSSFASSNFTSSEQGNFMVTYITSQSF